MVEIDTSLRRELCGEGGGTADGKKGGSYLGHSGSGVEEKNYPARCISHDVVYLSDRSR